MSTPSESSTRNPLFWTCFQFVYSSLIICINHAFVNIPVWKRGLVSQAGGCTLPTAVCNCNVLLPDILATRQILTHGFGNTAPTPIIPHAHLALYRSPSLSRRLLRLGEKWRKNWRCHVVNLHSGVSERRPERKGGEEDREALHTRYTLPKVCSSSFKGLLSSVHFVNKIKKWSKIIWFLAYTRF